MTNKKEYFNKCFSPNWVEVNLETVQSQQKEVIEISVADNEPAHISARKDNLENRQRKDLNTLLRELEEIKQNIERVAEKQHRLANLMQFYVEDFV